jgi:hypothetical protein
LSLGILLILHFLAAKGLDKFTELPGRHVVMIESVFPNNRSQCAGPQTIDVFNREKAIGGHLAWLNAELASGLAEEKVSAPDMAGRAQAHGQYILARWL